MATEIAVPLERVREGAAIIAKGSFDINLEEGGKDEIGALVSAFNKMAKELKLTKAEIEEKTKVHGSNPRQRGYGHHHDG